MKIASKLLLSIFIALNFQACTQKQDEVLLEKPAVDKRVELLSIVFCLAEKQEYSSKNFRLYSDRVEQYFEKYRNHELICFTKSIINENEIAFDGPMWLAVHLDDSLELLTDVEDVWLIDPRWTKEKVEKFVPLLQKFNKDTKFDEFFKDNTDLYTEAVKRFAPVYEHIDLNWLFSFFGREPKEKFSIKIGFGTGSNCYGVSLNDINGYKEVYAIVGIGMFDNAGLPLFSRMHDLPLVIHEFSHPYIDNLTAKNRELFRESGEMISSDAITEAYPSWEIVLDEALVMASMTKYMKDHDFEPSEIEMWINVIKKEFGFLWIEELVGELEKYDKQRDKYPTLESYMPKLSEVYNAWTETL